MFETSNCVQEMIQLCITGVIDLEVDKFYPCEFGEHWVKVKECLFEFLVREHMMLLDDYCDEKGISPNILQETFLENIPLRFYSLCECYIKENIILLGDTMGKEFYEDIYTIKR